MALAFTLSVHIQKYIIRVDITYSNGYTVKKEKKRKRIMNFGG